MRWLSIILLAFFLVACAPIKVQYDYDKNVDFSTYKTYQYFADMDTGLSTFDTKRLLDAIDLKIQTLGFKISETPDFYIDIKSKAFQTNQHSSVGVGLGGGGGHVGGGLSVGIPIGSSQTNAELTIHFVDHGKNQLFWQAISTFSFNANQTPDQKEAQFKTLVEKVLAEYPPKGL
ncbi:DUF4136 domain-containing protein [Pseudotamlana carrageenivorans]|uniref:DUF4136 domain-containing protein n=1 Tax=Pseudotamlana carrageenivorans TaxID=2069432 RepID=A0A2I7SFJ9_9FLAO|nr:DUF4136 domain-containing protein [Tamlana carrageenivorans]AUS04681.1 DUF4136 domain-containing protein [Tamlana carrageenivorans]